MTNPAIYTYLRSFNCTEDGMEEAIETDGRVETGSYVRTSDYLLMRRDFEEQLKLQASAALRGMDAATSLSYAQLEAARRLKGESSPDALESERAANARLTEEVDEWRNQFVQQRELAEAGANTIALQRMETERLQQGIRDLSLTCCGDSKVKCNGCRALLVLIDGAIKPNAERPYKERAGYWCDKHPMACFVPAFGCPSCSEDREKNHD